MTEPATVDTELLVVGAGPYALSVASLARERGLRTTVLGRPMSFWQDHMPPGMYLRSGPDWHLDPAGVHTFEAFIAERGISVGDIDPIPIAVFLAYAEWFRQAKRIEVTTDLVRTLARADGRFVATLESGATVRADTVVAAPGIRHYTNRPDWAAKLPPGRATHTCELVDLDRLDGARVVVVGGRQSAYEWAALAVEHGAVSVDVVHRHDVPRFDRVSWRFADEHVERTVAVRGYWRSLPQAERDAVARRFWEVGRLTLEHWLVPRLPADRVTRRPGTHVVDVSASDDPDEALDVQLSDGTRLAGDHIVLATGYRAEIGAVPYLGGVLDELRTADGFPVLDEGFGTSVDGLYVTGFSATRDFGPFFGFVRGSAASATVIVDDVLARQ